MTRITILTCLLVGATIVSPSALAETALQKGVRLYNARQFTEAISTLMVAAQQDGRNAEVHYNLGNAFLQTGDSVRAVREYELGFSLAGTGPVAVYCRSALAAVRQRNRSSMANTTYRTTTSYTGWRSSSVIKCPIGTESHDDGVQKSRTGLNAAEWSVWREYYDKAFKRLEMKVILSMVPNWQNMTGISELYYYVDRNRKLRARVNRSTTDDSVNAALLEVVRNLDGTTLIEFPSIIKADSFNFYHGVDLGEVALALKQQGNSTSTVVTMPNSNASLRQTGQSAAQGKLQTAPASTDVSASLKDPKVTADVAGKVISKNTTELKATQQVLPPDTALRDVQRQVVKDIAQKAVSGQLADTAQKAVTGQLTGTSTQVKIEPPKPPDDKTVPAK